MKKLLATILAVVYLSSSIGATVHMHYCMDKLVAWGFGNVNTGKDSCTYCGMGKSAGDKHCRAESKGCCKDSQKQVKLDNDQKPSEVSIKVEKNTAAIISPVFADYTFKYVSFLAEEYPPSHAPPQITHFPLYVLNCVYRI